VNMFLCGLLGLPPTNGLIPQAPLHVRSLARIENYVENGKLKERYTGVAEQRVSNLGQALLIGATLSPPLLRVLGLIPSAVLSGLFLFMGLASFNGNEFYERIMLIFTDRRHVHGPPAFIDRVRYSDIMKFTAVQFACWAVIYAVTWTQAAITFPVLIAILVPLREFVFPKFLSRIDLNYMDSESEIIDPGLTEKDDGKDEESQRVSQLGENSVRSSGPARSSTGATFLYIEPPSPRSQGLIKNEDEKKEEGKQVPQPDMASVHSMQHPASMLDVTDTTLLCMEPLGPNSQDANSEAPLMLPPALERERLLRQNEDLRATIADLRKELGLEPVEEEPQHPTDGHARVDDVRYEAMRRQFYQAKQVSYVSHL